MPKPIQAQTTPKEESIACIFVFLYPPNFFVMAETPNKPMNPVVMRKGCHEKNLHPAPVGCVETVYPTAVVYII